MPDAWLKGPVPEVCAPLQPVAHAFLNLRIELEVLLADARDEELRRRPGGAASVSFHIRHLCGSVDRLLTYARGESLDESQLAKLADEKRADSDPNARELKELVTRTLDAAMSQLRATPEPVLDEGRAVGRQKLSSTVRGLLFHAAEHGARHTGQAITTMKIVRGSR